MTTVNVYLNFNGNCLKAFHFYQKVFGGEFIYVGKYKDMPHKEGAKELSTIEKEKIMHIALPISAETFLYGSDHVKGFGPDWVEGNNFSISVTVDSKEKADEIFKKLSDGAKILMPIGKAFWGAYYGNLIDKFGIGWMVNFEMAETK